MRAIFTGFQSLKQKNYWENLAFLKLETSSAHSGSAFLCLTLEWSQRSKNLCFTVPHANCGGSWTLLFPLQMAGKGERAADIVSCIYTHISVCVWKKQKDPAWKENKLHHAHFCFRDNEGINRLVDGQVLLMHKEDQVLRFFCAYLHTRTRIVEV